MKRLTNRYSNGEAFIMNCTLQTTNGIEDIIEKLAYYEDLEEQGFILKAPCRIDDTVYVKTRYSVARPYEIVKCRVSKIAALSSGKGASITCAGRYENGNPYNGNFRLSSFGKKVFTSKEEAEKHLND